MKPSRSFEDDRTMRLLVAEDEAPIRDLLVRGLSESGYVVDTAENGGDALHLLRLYDYAAAIIDWRMPEKTGVEVIRAARLHHLEVVESRRPDHFDPGLLGHAPVDDCRGVVVQAQQVERVSAVLRGVDHVPTLAEAPDEQVTDWSLVLGHQKPHR